MLFTWNPSPLQSSKFSFQYLLLPPRSAAPERREKYKPDVTFLGTRKEKYIFDMNTQCMNEEDYYLLRTYLNSGGGTGTSAEVESYLFALMDVPTRHDYERFKVKQEKAEILITIAFLYKLPIS